MKLLLITLSAAALLLAPTIPINPAGSFAQQRPQDKDKPPASADTDADIVRVETDLVTTVFTALDKDRRFVTNLQAEDIRIKENGIEQEISLFERETNRPLTIVVMVDTSRSQERTLPEEKSAAKKFINSIMKPDRDQVAIVSFTGAPKIELPLSNNAAALRTAVDRVEVKLPEDGCDPDIPVDLDARCYTSIWDSVLATSEQLLAQTKKGARRVIILLTDGDDTASKVERDDAIKAAIGNDVVIYGICVGDPELYKMDKSALRKLAEKTGGRAFFPDQDSNLDHAFAQIQEEMRSQYVVAYSPRDRTRDGSYRKLKIDVTNKGMRDRKLQLLHRPGYYSLKQ